ncbi:hypothetical protein Y1Q_0021907 [Alligator mississippiensis]|uniref:Uncharacterized protein n=1 Tax=Alligator mississippiensis TaxID=8496 RepID=A0A151MTP3_ALLMI|nr:hypothetical protein Y1Q_0021907 [Alligator mississippiensis]
MSGEVLAAQHSPKARSVKPAQGAAGSGPARTRRKTEESGHPAWGQDVRGVSHRSLPTGLRNKMNGNINSCGIS